MNHASKTDPRRKVQHTGTLGLGCVIFRASLDKAPRLSFLTNGGDVKARDVNGVTARAPEER